MQMSAFENERCNQSRDAVLPLERKPELAREDSGLEVAKENKTSVSGWVVSMINMKTVECWQVPL